MMKLKHKIRFEEAIDQVFEDLVSEGELEAYDVHWYEEITHDMTGAAEIVFDSCVRSQREQKKE